MKEFLFCVAAITVSAVLSIAILDRYVLAGRYQPADTAAVLSAERTAAKALELTQAARAGIGDAALVCLALILGVVVVCVVAICKKPTVQTNHYTAATATHTEAITYQPDPYQTGYQSGYYLDR